MVKNRFLLAVAVMAILLTTSVYASQCVECHTDIEKLKAIAKTIVKPIGSTETAGKG
ncbi:MAG: hypothetical protein KAU22_01765 [Desulfuromonadales bacterium]|nr:hypothetical protein [Desulfuromonadales bacterium]